MTTTLQLPRERADLLETLRTTRDFLRHTVRNLTEEQIRLRPTASELSLGGILKHVTAVERNWADFVQHGRPFEAYDEAKFAEHAATFQLTADETLDVLLKSYDDVARQTDELVATLPDLDLAQELPDAPWETEKGRTMSVRRAFIHIAAETAQHAGHADIIRETIDGQKTMG